MAAPVYPSVLKGWRGWLVSLCAVIGAPAFGAVRITTQGDHLVHYISIEGIAQNTVDHWGDAYTAIRLQGVEGYEGAKYSPGRPGIPVVRFYVEGEGVITVLPGAEFVGLPVVDDLIYPFQMSMAKNFRGAKPFFFNAQAYEEDEFTPSQAFDIADAGQVRGVKRRLVTLYPYYYKPKTGEQKFRTEFTVYSPLPKAQAAAAEKPTILFVSGEAFAGSAALAAYAKFKESQGFAVRLESLGDGLRTADEIRAKVQEVYRDPASNLRFVILVGDVAQLPGYPAKKLKNADAVTDHYYSAIDTDDYATDIAGPDVAVGRFSVTTEAELQTVVEKYMRYQKAEFTDLAWLSALSFVATDDEMNNAVAEGSHDFVMAHYTAEKFVGTFPEAAQKGGDALYAITHEATSANLLKEFAAGRAIINYSGHGSEHSWEGPEFQIDDIAKIAHNESLPFVVSNACLTARFTEDLSFAEAWQRSSSGAAMFWGSMDNTFWDEDDILERAMYRALFVDHGRKFSELTQPALTEVWRYYGGEGRSDYYWETYVSLGDPSAELQITR